MTFGYRAANHIIRRLARGESTAMAQHGTTN
jgi:hypothetical protein